MDIDKFQKESPGRLVPLDNVPGVSHAFIPDPLPPKWEWPEDLYPLLIDARTALASLDGTGKHLPNSQLVIGPLQNREAQISSKLEGTITQPEQQILFQIDPSFPRSEADPVNAFREVFNYGQALRYPKERGASLPISLRLIRDLHGILLHGVRGSDQSPGRFRRLQNTIGNPPHYVPPPSNYLDDALRNFEGYLHSNVDYDPLVKAFITHYQFEAIHPFRDGNGRIGRLLMAILIEEWCELSDQWLYMSSYFEKNRSDYIDLLLRISTHNDWESWIRFCLKGVIEVSNETEKRCSELIALEEEYKNRIEQGSYRLSVLVERLFQGPATTIPMVARLFDTSYHTAKRDVEKLMEVGILNEIRNQRPKVYYAKEIFDVTYRDI